MDERPADPRPAMQGSRTATADIRQFQTVISHLATAVRCAVVAPPTTVVSRTPVPQSTTVSRPTTTLSQPTAPQSTTVSQSPASDTPSTPRPQTATVNDAQSIPRPQTATVTATAVSRPVTQDSASDIPMDTVEGAVGPVSEQSASQVVAPSTADVTQIAIKSETEDPDMPALEEVSPTLNLEVRRVISAVQLEDTSILTPAEVEVLRARQLEEHGEVLSPAMPPVQNTPNTSTSTPVQNTPDATTSTPTETSQEGQTKVKSVASSQGQTKGKTTAPTSQKTRTAGKKSTGYNRAPPSLKTDLLEGLRGIDVRRTLDQIKMEVAELDATRLTQAQHDLRSLRLRQSWMLGDHLKGVRINMSDEDAMEFIQCGGDWNFTIDNNTDRSGGNLRVWHKSVKEFTQISELFDLVDIWRTRNPFSCRYTWRCNRPSLVKSQIDRIYISDNLHYNCEKADIIPGICLDHSAPCATFKRLNNESKGRNYWKMNNSLLEENEFVGLMSNKITEFVQMSQQLTSERSKWEYIKYKIREWVQQQSKIKARDRREAVKQLEVEVNSLEQQLNSTPWDAEEVYIRLERAR